MTCEIRETGSRLQGNPSGVIAKERADLSKHVTTRRTVNIVNETRKINMYNLYISHPIRTIQTNVII